MDSSELPTFKQVMVGRIGELNGIIKALLDKHPQGFYANIGNGKKASTKNYR